MRRAFRVVSRAIPTATSSERPKQKPRSSQVEVPGQRCFSQFRPPIDSRRSNQVGRRQVFWLPALEAPKHDTQRFGKLFLPPRLPIPATHGESGILRRSSPVTAARPRPIFTAFPFGPLFRRATCNRKLLEPKSQICQGRKEKN